MLIAPTVADDASVPGCLVLAAMTEPAAAAQFPGWLEAVVKRFSSLEPEQQTLTLNQLISCCGSQQLWHLQHKLPDFLYRDFIK